MVVAVHPPDVCVSQAWVHSLTFWMRVWMGVIKEWSVTTPAVRKMDGGLKKCVGGKKSLWLKIWAILTLHLTIREWRLINSENPFFFGCFFYKYCQVGGNIHYALGLPHGRLSAWIFSINRSEHTFWCFFPIKSRLRQAGHTCRNSKGTPLNIFVTQL